MKCPVCNHVFVDVECPRCQFPVVDSPNPEALIEMLRPQIEAYRADFQAKISFALKVFFWKDQNDAIVLDREQLLPFGSYSELKGKQGFLPQSFARIPDVNQMELQVLVTVRDQPETRTVAVQNLKEAALQSVGIETNEQYQFRLLLKNTNNSQTASAWQEIFA